MAASCHGAILLTLLAVLAPGALAVDRSKFRTCEQGSFCRRYRKWATRPNQKTPLWSVLPATRQQNADGSLSFKVQHLQEAEPHLLFTVDAYDSGIARLRLNEIAPVHPRHVIPPGDAVSDPPPKPTASLAVVDAAGVTELSWTSSAGTLVKVEITHSPLSVRVFANGVPLQTLNSRNMLNFERYRQPKSRLPPDSASDVNANPDGVLMDAAAHPHGLDTDGLWEEDFGGHTDRKPRGPASLGVDVTFEGNVPSLLGLPEHMTKAALPFYEEPYRFFNLDVFEYENNEPMALYGAVPLIWAIHRGDGAKVPTMTSAFLWINPSETFVKLERVPGQVGSTMWPFKASADGPASAWWTSESGVMDVAIFAGPTPRDVSGQFHSLTGHAPLPPLWSMAKHQCRWNYMSEADALSVDSQYDKHDLPYDVLWLDIEHTDGKAYFTWHPTHFPTPEKMTGAISDKRRLMVNVVDPHIKKDEKFHVYKEIRDQGMFTKKVQHRKIDDPSETKPTDWVDLAKIDDANAVKPDTWNEAEQGVWVAPQIDNPAYTGVWKPRQIQDPNPTTTDFEGWCWPGTSGYPDFTDPKMRDYWGSQFALDKYKGTNKDVFIWNDMNEPSVFNGPEVTMPRDAIHPHGNVEHRDVHNMYGYYVHRATYEGLEKRSPGDRAFVLTRSFFIGSHKYSAIWTGDNFAKWDHLGTSVAMVGALTLAGQSLVGADVGGFFEHPNAEMITRWYQFGVLAYPFLRSHAHLETPRREPYMYDDATMLLVKDALQQRYRLLPLWYTVFEEYHRSGAPVVRPLFWDFLEDAETHAGEAAVENQIMLGDVLLSHCVSKPLSEATSTRIYLPKVAGWFDHVTGAFSLPGAYTVPLTLKSIPAFFRAGRIVPLKDRVRRSSDCMKMDPHTLAVYLDPVTGEAEGRLYVDDYRTKKHEEGEYLSVSFTFKGGVLRATSTSGKPPAEVSTMVEAVRIFGLASAPAGAVLSAPGAGPRELARPESWLVAAGPGGKALTAALVKVQPLIDLRHGSEWSLTVA